jgi:hypothetical protein
LFTLVPKTKGKSVFSVDWIIEIPGIALTRRLMDQHSSSRKLDSNGARAAKRRWGFGVGNATLYLLVESRIPDKNTLFHDDFHVIRQESMQFRQHYVRKHPSDQAIAFDVRLPVSPLQSGMLLEYFSAALGLARRNRPVEFRSIRQVVRRQITHHRHARSQLQYVGSGA